MENDLISRQAAIDALKHNQDVYSHDFHDDPIDKYTSAIIAADIDSLVNLPAVQSEQCEYYALCWRGRDENKLRARLKICEYCNEDADGFVTPVEKNGHAFVRFGINGWELSLKANGWHGSAKIRYCPMCGRDLLVK